MPRAVAEPVRRELVRRHLAGESLPELAAAFRLPFETVRGLWRRYRRLGEAAYCPDYHRCAHPGPRFPPELHQQALALKQAHPRYGAGLVRLLLAEAFPPGDLPRLRTLQAWFQAAGLQPPRSRKLRAPRTRAQQAHAVWQLDAKERIRLGSGQEVCVFSLVDEATGAALGAVTFSPGPSATGARHPPSELAAAELPALGAPGTAAGR